MASLRFCFSFFIFCACNIIIFPNQCFATACLPKQHNALFVFGDSLFDIGNNNYFNAALKANFVPYGETFFKYASGRFTDGRVISDFIGKYYKCLQV